MGRSRPSRANVARAWRGLTWAMIAAVSIALVGAGCGGDDEDTATTKSSGLSQTELVAQATPICKRHYQTITAAASKVLAGGKLPDPKKFGMLAVGTIIPELTAQNMQLRALEPAEGAATEWNAWLDAADATVAEIRKDPSLITDATNFKDVNAQADALGLPRECHVGPGS